MFKVNFKKWIFPGLILVILITTVSCIVTKSQQNKTEEIIEGLSNPPTDSTKNLSTEKAKLLFPYIRAYLLSNYPTRKSVTSDDDNKVSVRWEDLSGNKNDFIWSSKPKLSKHKGFNTKDNILQGPSTGFMEYGNTHEFTIILRVALVQKDTIQTEISTPTDIGEVGRLDYETSGLIMMTDDSKLLRAIIDPSEEDSPFHSKEYILGIRGKIEENNPKFINLS